MKIVVLSLIIALACLPLTAAEQSHRVSEIDQPAVERQIDRLGDSTLNQAPNQVNGIFSDEGCDICGAGVQVLGENFTVITAGMGFDLEQIVIWGGYYPNDVPTADDFDVLIHSDAAGLPGTVICTETGIVATSRTATGVVLFGVSEYMVTLDLAAACNLADGTYWLEVYNNTGTGTDDWFWEEGNIDAVNGTIGSTYAFEAPGVSWSVDSDSDFATQLNGTVVPVELQSFSIE